jgi:hypothetical protein
MQKTIKLLGAIAVPGLLCTTNLFGLSTTLDLSPTGYRDPNSVGGEFTAVLSGDPAESTYILNNYASVAKTSSGFETFCVEMNVTFDPGTTYATTISPTMEPGNTALSVGVAWLYMEFASGKLATAGTTYGISGANYSYTTGTGRETAADELQDAIWYLSGEINSSTSGYVTGSKLLYKFTASSDPYVALVDKIFGTSGAEASATAGEFGVDVLNLSTTTGYGADCQTVYAQDQLVYCPVPEASTVMAGALMLLPLGLSAVRSFRKKS